MFAVKIYSLAVFAVKIHSLAMFAVKIYSPARLELSGSGKDFVVD